MLSVHTRDQVLKSFVYIVFRAHGPENIICPLPLGLCVFSQSELLTSICPNGLAGIQDDTVCCAEGCDGVCGGLGCDEVPFTNGATDCCSATILDSGVSCDDGVEAPCIMVDGTYTDFPTAAPLLGATIKPTISDNIKTGAPAGGTSDVDGGSLAPILMPLTPAPEVATPPASGATSLVHVDHLVTLAAMAGGLVSILATACSVYLS